jgi:hypothetical protein
MPVVFIFSAMVSGIAGGHAALHGAHQKLRGQKIDMHCVDTIAMYMFYIFVIDFSLEMLDLIHRIYEADESFRSLNFMVHTKLLLFADRRPDHAWAPFVPLLLLFLTQVWKSCLSALPCASGSTQPPAALIMVGVFAMRWNVVIGGQLFSKSFLGYTTYKMEPGDRARGCWQPSL